MAALVAASSSHQLCSSTSSCTTNPSNIQSRPFATSLGTNPRNARSWASTVARVQPKKKGWFDDPFDFGPDDEEDTNGDLMSSGPQSAEDPTGKPNPDSEFGYLEFPPGYMPEIASLGTMLRNDVRRCLCVVAGGVYENLLFFPVVQLLKNRYPGVKIDVMATERGKQTYEINKNVRKAWAHPVDDQFLRPVEFTESVGKIKGQYYDLVVSTKLAGMGHSIFLWMGDIRNKVSYIYPDVNAVGAGKFLDVAIQAPQLELAESGFNMYAEMIDVLAEMGKNMPRTELPPLEVAVSKRVRAYVEAKYTEAGVSGGESFLVFHGLDSESSASMTSKGDTDSLLPISMWAEIAKSTSEKVVFVIPNERDRTKVKEICGENSHIVYITTPGQRALSYAPEVEEWSLIIEMGGAFEQLAALISASSGVVTTNTAALQLAIAMKKPTVALFSSQEKARLFVPSYAKDCAVVAAKTGELPGLDLKATAMALSTIAKEAVVAA